MESVADKLAEVLHNSKQVLKEKHMKSRIYYACPGTLKMDFELVCLNRNMVVKLVKTFRRHFSAEALPYYDSIANMYDQLSLHLYTLTTT